jgi:hypothetical protein
MTSEGTRALQDLRRALLDPPAQLRPEGRISTRKDQLTETV